MEVGSRVKVYGFRGTCRYGIVMHRDIHGMIVNLFFGGSMYFQRQVKPRGACFNSGGYSVYPV